MPNWCECTVRLKGKELEKVHSLLQVNGVITMKKIIPEPFEFIDSHYAYILSKDEYMQKCEKLNSDYYSGSRYGVFLDYLLKLSNNEVQYYDKVNMLDKAVFNFNWYAWRKYYWGVKADIGEVITNEIGFYKYYTPWGGNINFWKKVSDMYKVDVEILEDEPSDSLFSKTIIKNGIISNSVVFSNEIEFRKNVDNLTDKETANLLLEMYNCCEDLEDNCDYIYLIEKYIKLIDLKSWKLKD